MKKKIARMLKCVRIPAATDPIAAPRSEALARKEKDVAQVSLGMTRLARV
ncbi:MAG: hypothetical protein LAP85_14275 [Acidobacteriia bacterium]|nr:hypothetical protein [Terriglobia bacterium]